MELHDIWRVKNPEKPKFTWSRKQPTKVKSRLDYWLSSVHIEDYTEQVDIIPFISSDHNAITIKLNSSNEDKSQKGRRYWKMNTSFLNEENYIKGITENNEVWLEEVRDSNDTVKWEYIKFKIRQFSIHYGKTKAKYLSNEEKDLEKKLYQLEEDLESGITEDQAECIEEELNTIKSRLEDISNYKTEGLILRSGATWYEMGEKSNSYFLRLETRNRIKKSVNKLSKSDGTYTTNSGEIMNMQREFYRKLYSSKCERSVDEIENYLVNVKTPFLSEEEKMSAEGLITSDECQSTLKTFKNNKTRWPPY